MHGILFNYVACANIGGGGRPLNFGGYKKSAIGGIIFEGFVWAKLTKIFCEIFNFSE